MDPLAPPDPVPRPYTIGPTAGHDLSRMHHRQKRTFYDARSGARSSTYQAHDRGVAVIVPPVHTFDLK